METLSKKTLVNVEGTSFSIFCWVDFNQYFLKKCPGDAGYTSIFLYSMKHPILKICMYVILPDIRCSSMTWWPQPINTSSGFRWLLSSSVLLAAVNLAGWSTGHWTFLWRYFCVASWNWKIAKIITVAHNSSWFYIFAKNSYQCSARLTS